MSISAAANAGNLSQAAGGSLTQSSGTFTLGSDSSLQGDFDLDGGTLANGGTLTIDVTPVAGVAPRPCSLPADFPPVERARPLQNHRGDLARAGTDMGLQPCGNVVARRPGRERSAGNAHCH